MRFSLVLLLVGILSHGNVWAQESVERKPIRLGLLPYLSSQKLVATYTPLVNYLEHRLGRKFVLVTAPDFVEYFRRSNKGRYDFYMTAPHFAAYAEVRHKHRRLVRLSRELNGTIVVRRDSAIHSLSDLNGKVLATPDRLAVITILTEQLLQQAGLEPGKNITIRYASSHNNAIRTVLNGLSDAAVSLTALYARLDNKKKSRLRVLAVTREIPHVMFMASPGLDIETCKAIKHAMLEFSVSHEGKAFFKATAFVNFIEITDENMNSVKDFVPMIEQRLK